MLIITFINFLIIFFHSNHLAVFLQASNSTYMIITLVILLSQLQKLILKKKIIKIFLKFLKLVGMIRIELMTSTMST